MTLLMVSIAVLVYVLCSLCSCKERVLAIAVSAMLPQVHSDHAAATGWQTANQWLSGNTLASINVVALRQTRLVLGWVTVCGRVNHLSM